MREVIEIVFPARKTRYIINSKKISFRMWTKRSGKKVPEVNKKRFLILNNYHEPVQREQDMCEET